MTDKKFKQAHKILEFINQDDSLFNPFKLLECWDFTRKTAKIFIDVALETQSEMRDSLGVAHALNCHRYIKLLGMDEIITNHAIDIFIQEAKHIYYQSAEEE